MKNLLHVLAAIAADVRPQHRELLDELVAAELGNRPVIELVQDEADETLFTPKPGQAHQARYFGTRKPANKAKAK
jgi:hypothetical protein